MKKIVFTLVGLIVSTLLYSQTYYDAILLANSSNYDPVNKQFKKNDVVKGKLKTYFNVNSFEPTTMDTNPYLKHKYWGETASDPARTNPSALEKFSLPAIGGIDVTPITDGIAQFLAERAKEELNIAFFERFRELLKIYPELGTTFPNTTYFLSTIMNYNYAHLLPTMREAFIKDLDNLPNSLMQIPNIPESECDLIEKKKQCQDCKVRLKVIKDFYSTPAGLAVSTALHISQAAINKEYNPVAIINQVANGIPQNATNDFASALKLTQVISNSLRSNQPGQFYISKDELNALYQNSDVLEIYLGLLLQEIKASKIQFGGVQISSLIDSSKTESFKKLITDYAITINRIQVDAVAIQSEKTATIDNAKITQLLSDIQKLLKLSNQWENIHVSLKLPPQVSTVFNAIDNGLSLSTHILTKNYFAAILDASQLVNIVMPTHTTSGNSFKTDITNNDIKSNYLQQLTKYGTFIAAVSSAKTSAEVKEIIKATALPPGSASIKKNTNFSIALQAYVGGIYGKEYIISNSKTSSQIIAPFAPIGISFNVGLKNHQNAGYKWNAGSLSAVVQLVDIGAMVAYRITNSDTLPASVKIRFENIFAPGLNLVYGIPKVPISIGGGFQWLPSNFGNSFYKDYTVRSNSGIRAQLFMAVDIPMFNLFATSK